MARRVIGTVHAVHLMRDGGSQMNQAIRAARVEDALAIARVQVDTWRTTYPGIVPDAVLASLSVEQRAAVWAQILASPATEQVTYVAEASLGQVVGFANAGPNRDPDPAYAGELRAIYLLADHQHHGLGRRLIRTAAQRLKQMDLRSLLVWVLARNPARGFYEALGGRVIQERQLEEHGVILDEVAYGWADIGILLQDHERGTRVR